MLPLPLHLQHLPLTLQNILTNCDGVCLDLSEQLFDLNPQETQDVLEHIFKHFTHLKELDLGRNNLEILPDAIGNLTQLTHLYLYSNKLTSLPEIFGHLTQLITLNLFNNQLNCLPDTLGHLTELTVLHLHNNHLTNLPETFGNLIKLETLFLGDNQLTNLPETFGNLTQLTYLYLSYNKLTSLPLSIIKLPDHMTCLIKDNHFAFLPAWQTDYEDVFKPLKVVLQSILSLDEVKQAKNFFSYSSLSKECYHLIKGKLPIASEEKTSQAPTLNNASSLQPLLEFTQKPHYLAQFPNDISKIILLHAAEVPPPNRPQFMQSFRKHLSDKPSFNSLRCFLEEVAPDWRKRVLQSYNEAQKTSAPHRE